MSDPSRAKPSRRIDADATRVEDDRQLTELLMQNRVSVKETLWEPAGVDRAPSLSERIQTAFLLFVAIPLLLLAYFSSRTEEDDFYA